MWQSFFDRIIVIHLPDRRDRFKHFTKELAGIDYQIFLGVKKEDGREGIWLSLKEIFEESLDESCENILVFEDDCKLLHNPNDYMNDCIQQLPDDWDMLFFGCNIYGKVKKYSPNLLQLNTAVALHAVAYSRKCMEEILKLPVKLPIDLSFSENIVSKGRCFATIPMLATQIESYSDIEKRDVNYKKYLEDRYEAISRHNNIQ